MSQNVAGPTSVMARALLPGALPCLATGAILHVPLSHDPEPSARAIPDTAGALGREHAPETALVKPPRKTILDGMCVIQAAREARTSC